MSPVIPADSVRVDALLRAARHRPLAPVREIPPRLLLVDVERQELLLLERGTITARYRVSTAAAGIGGTEGSHRTPPGWHRIARKIGAGAASGTRFVSREPSGEIWRGEATEDDLILTRVLTLDGLEPGINQGPGRDSLERYIYFHGTNQEARLGEAGSHGCIRMANADVIELFERVSEGDPVVVVEHPAIPDPCGAGRFHYAGLGGSGMSALAQYQVMLGGRASGSDRTFDRGDRPAARAQLERLGIRVTAQDGSGLDSETAALVVSTAVEDSVPDVAAAKQLGIPIVHRSELLAHFVETSRSIAVTGTSGKSTVVAMIFEMLRGAGRAPSVITGGDLPSLQAEGLWGNAFHGGSDLLVVEADESDGSVVRYEPAIGVVLNLQKDHKAMDDVARMFETFRGRVRERLVVGDVENLAFLSEGALTFGFSARAAVRGTGVEVDADRSTFRVDGVAFTLPVPGGHNVENALAAIAACRAVGVALEEMVAPLAAFHGVGRRFQTLGTARGVEVVDDFAHNPAKIAAALETAKRRAARVLAVYQPHGYGPTRFLRADFVATFATALRAEDRLWLLEVFYAGGTAQRDFSAADIVTEIAARRGGATTEFAPSREWLIERLVSEARSGDLVLIMGARDPSLTEMAKSVLAGLA